MDWKWFLDNYSKDQKEQSDLIELVLNILKPWLDNELYQQVRKNDPQSLGLPSEEETKDKLLQDDAFQDLIEDLRKEGQKAKEKREQKEKEQEQAKHKIASYALEQQKQNEELRKKLESGESIILE